MIFRRLLAICLPLLLVTIGLSQALTSPDAPGAVIEMRTPAGTRQISMSVETASAVEGLLQHLIEAIHMGNQTATHQAIMQLGEHGIDLSLPGGLLNDGTVPASNRLCMMYGAFSKALFSYPLDLAMAGVLSLFNGFSTIGLFLLWSVITHALHPVHFTAPLMFMTVLDGATGQLVTRGIDGTQVITADELSTHVIVGFAGTIINIIVPVQGAPDPAFCVGAALLITPAP